MTDIVGKGGDMGAAHRTEDEQVLRERLRRYRKAFHVGQLITAEIDRDRLFEAIIHQTNELMDSARSTVFLHDAKAEQLWSLVGVGLEKKEIRIPSDHGVAGWVFQHRVPVTVNDAYKDPRFYAEVDKESGFKTRNIMCVPLVTWAGNCIGTLQSLNKRAGDFTDDDFQIFTHISDYVTVAVENMQFFEELRDVNKARERAVNHLSHELKTPLALIRTVFDQCLKFVPEGDDGKQVRIIQRGLRNVGRLSDLQEKIDDILCLRAFEEKDRMCHIVASAADFVEESIEKSDTRHAEVLAMILKRIESVYGPEDVHPKRIDPYNLLNDIVNHAVDSMEGRELEIIRNLEKGDVVDTEEEVLRKVFEGLLKNAIENTPDEGKVEVGLKGTDHDICVIFRDYGTGISEQNQRLIFQGFFHTQDTMNYSSKRPYQFNAGGAGADLLRTKVFSERCGFSVTLESTRCRFIPHDSDECPGRISACGSVQRKEDCFSSGGSIFSVRFIRKPSVVQ